jgi:hypothetical protein
LQGETEQTIVETADFCRRNLTPTTFFYATAYPETELYSYALGTGKIKDEEEFIAQLGDVDQMTMNLSDIPDERFVDLKTEMEEATHLPLLVFLYRYWRRYGVANLIRYLHFIWESYPTSEIVQKLVRMVRKKPAKANRLSDTYWLDKSKSKKDTKELFSVS